MTSVMADLILAYEQAISRIVLYAVSEMSSPPDINGLVTFLKGVEKEYTKEYDLYDHTAYSVLSTFSEKQLNKIIIRLEVLKLLCFEITLQSQRKIILVKITEEGLDFLNNSSDAKIGFMRLLR
jgi:hypothetical protein